jgi:hypothetical protein
MVRISKPPSLAPISKDYMHHRSQDNTPEKQIQGAERLPAVPDVDDLQPSGVLNREAMKGAFSLRHILSTNDGDSFEQLADGVMSVPAKDPISLGLVNKTIAGSLFDK